LESETLEIIGSKESSFLVQTCKICGARISVDAGDVLYGGEWFHGSCWNTNPRSGSPREDELARLLGEEPERTGRR
jgi:hypothetical protein